MVIAVILAGLLGAAITCMILAYFTDYEAAGSAGCIPPGQVW